MTLGERLRAILDELPAGWSEVRLNVTIAEDSQADRAALILASLAPGRTGAAFRLRIVAKGYDGPSPDAVRRALERLDREQIDARLSPPDTGAVEVAPPAREEAAPRGLAESWKELTHQLPDDWSDLYVEVELASSDEIDRAALLMGPVNPLLYQGIKPAFRFRAARRFGYGAAPGMARRCLERLDEAHIAGRLRILRVLSETAPVLTQGPVWREGGRAI